VYACFSTSVTHHSKLYTIAHQRRAMLIPHYVHDAIRMAAKDLKWSSRNILPMQANQFKLTFSTTFT